VTIQQAFQIALQHHQAGQLAAAEALCRQILAVEPGQVDSLHLLGVIAAQTGRSDLAVDLIGRAIALKPHDPEALSNLGNALRDRGDLDEAISAYRQAIGLKPDFSQAHHNLGLTLKDKGQLDEAIAASRQAIVLSPDFSLAYINLGNALHDKGQLDEAISAFRQAIDVKPDLPEAYSNLGNALYYKGQLDEAIAACRQALVLRSDFPEARSNLGNALRDKGQVDEAISAYRQAIDLKPGFPDAHSNLGVALFDKGQLDEAIAAHRQAIALKPNFPAAHFALALALLAQGDFIRGWEEYEWRWQLREGGPSPRNFPQPHWDGSPLHGRTILLHAEQGFGDTFQFIRYAPLVAQRGGRVIVECQPGFGALLASVAGTAQIVTCGEPLPAFDVHCPLMSLPWAFGTQLETIPADVPYLRTDATKVARWQERLARESTSPGPTEPLRSELLKVGLVWAGGSRPQQLNANRIDRRRSMHLSQFAPLAEVPGVMFVSLQKGGPAEQALTPPRGLRLLDWTAELQDFSDTAALVESLDLIISVDTAVAHLAGALGKPVWVINRFDSCWRWLRDRVDTPWYPTMRLFRQARPGDWGPVMELVAGALREASTSQPRHSSNAKKDDSLS